MIRWWASLLVLAVACGGGATGGGLERHELRGTVTAVVYGLSCPLHRGDTVRVLDTENQMIATGALDRPFLRRKGSVERCRATFTVPGLSRAERYRVQVANGSAAYSHEDLERLGWRISIVAGQQT